MKFITKNQSGVIMIGAFIITLFFVTVSIAVAEFGVTHFVSTKRTLVDYNTLSAAESGADAFLANLAANSNYQGTTNAPANATNSCTGYTSTPVVLTNNSTQGRVTYESCVKNGTIANEKEIFATAKTYLPASSTTPRITRKVRVIVTASTTGGYAVQTGPGGLEMSNGATIATGEVYVGGQISLSNNASIGTPLTPSKVYAANKACPTNGGSTYPTTCSQGGGPYQDPIYACCGNGNSNQKMIYGEVYAVNFRPTSNFDTNRTLSLMGNPGFVSNVVPNISMPADNRAALKSAGFPTSRTASSANCPHPTDTTTWAGGTRFTGGDINISNNCTVNVTGDIWISGSLTLSNNAKLVSARVDGQPVNIMIDGSSGFRPSNSSTLAVNSATNAGFNITTYYAAAACSPECTDATITGSELYNSRNNETIVLSNSFTGVGSKLYARWSTVTVNNSTTIGSITGQRVRLSNSGSITFGNSSAGATGNWRVRYYDQVYN